MTSPPPLDRRRALTALGTIGLGTVIAACAGESSSGSAAPASTPSTAPSSTAPGSTGSSNAVTPPDAFEDAASCTASPEMTEGPYYFDVDAIRSDIREDRDGVPLRLATRVLDASTCEPITDAVVDVWHCDAVGSYSGFESASRGGGNARDESTYLRGAQVTNADGITEFTTVYPGWYRGRTTHIHVKVHLDNSTLLTSQLYFPEDVNDAVYAVEPYASDDGRDTSNARDSIFDESMVMTLTPEGEGYVALMTINVSSSGSARSRA
jgi:protocatechuate 3,4-dioxygenase beta subunit